VDANAIVLGVVNTENNVAVTATAGAIMDGNGPANNITAGTVTLTGTEIGTTNDSLETAVGTLNATTVNGSIFIAETDAVTLGTITALGLGNDITIINTTGDMTINTVTSQDQVTLTASAGALLDGNGSEKNIQALHGVLFSSISIGTANDPVETFFQTFTLNAPAGKTFVNNNSIVLENKNLNDEKIKRMAENEFRRQAAPIVFAESFISTEEETECLVSFTIGGNEMCL
jgi:hypothetical protein